MTRAIIEAQRAGYVAGAQAASGKRWSLTREKAAAEKAARLFPFTIEHPRVLRILRPKMMSRGHTCTQRGTEVVEYRVVDGMLQVRNPMSPSWSAWRDTHRTRGELLTLVDLFDSPNRARSD